MRTIGIRQLKAQLSRVLRDVQAGETILVTDRGRAVAELRRPDVTSGAASSPEQALTRLAAQGQLRLAERQTDPYEVSPVTSPAGTARALLDEERGEA